jgi:hypothetical protein
MLHTLPTKTRRMVNHHGRAYAETIARRIEEGSPEAISYGRLLQYQAREITEKGTGPGRADRAHTAAEYLSWAAGVEMWVQGGGRTRYHVGDQTYYGGREIEALVSHVAGLLHYTTAREVLA